MLDFVTFADYKMFWRDCALKVAVLTLYFSFAFSKPAAVAVNISINNETTPNNNLIKHKNNVHSFHVAKFDYARIEQPFTIAVWVLIASLGKLGKIYSVLVNGTKRN